MVRISSSHLSTTVKPRNLASLNYQLHAHFVMNRTHPLLLAATITLLVSCTTSRNTAGSRTETLFNGRNLTGWKHVLADPAVSMEQVWSVRDGVIVCRGEPMGYLFTERNFTNYRMGAEYRWAPGKQPGNSGIFGRINGSPRALPRCLETQLKHGDAGDLYTFHGMKLSGAADRFKTVAKHELAGDLCGVKRITGQEKPAGEWTRVEVLANGPVVTVWMNGKRATWTSLPDRWVCSRRGAKSTFAMCGFNLWIEAGRGFLMRRAAPATCMAGLQHPTVAHRDRWDTRPRRCSKQSASTSRFPGMELCRPRCR